MVDQTDLYHALGQWVREASTATSDRVDELRDRFAAWEVEVFGPVERRTANPLAMDYDRIRNSIVDYSGDKDPENLTLATEGFLLLTRHYYLV